ANAWDSGATLVEININLKKDTITIEDNGDGMSLSDLNNKYLRIGYKKRSEKSSTFIVRGKNRHVMGRKGIGKLAPFALAEELEIQSSNGKDEKVGCIIKWSEFKKAIDEDKTVFTPISLAKSKIAVKKGTRLTLKLIRDDKKEGLGDVKALRKRIARRFTVIYPEFDFDVKIDGESITNKDRPYLNKVEFVWSTENIQPNISKHCKNLLREPIIVSNQISIEGKIYEISGWLGTVKEPKDTHDDGNDTISIFSHGKLVQEDILTDMAERQIYASYVVGDIQADFLDVSEKDDIVTPDRQRLNHNDPRYIKLKDHIKSEFMSSINSTWSNWRLERFVPKHPHIQAWYHNLKTKAAKKEAAQIYKKITEIASIDENERNIFNEIVLTHFDELKILPGLVNLHETEFIKQIRQFISQPSETPSDPTASQDSANTKSEESHQNSGAGNSKQEDDQKGNTPDSQDETPPNNDNSQGERPEGNRPTNEKSPKYQADYHFSEIRKLIKQIPVEKEFINIALFDLKDSQIAYNNTAYKACIVMLGAVLEGIMLSTIRRADVLQKLNQMPRQGIPPSVLNLGIQSQPIDTTEMADKISESRNIGFEEYRQIIKVLIPNIEDQLVQSIQQFRNSIHPYKAMKEPDVFAEPDIARAMMYITSLEVIVRKIASWKL
ncbi:MAG: ATP-binding protein, partial [Anaerolineales bacterium]|nr:ATP-binding protein [Anaerolineales bacterium]